MPNVVDPVVDVIDAVFFLDRAAFRFLLVQAVESRGQDLIVAGPGEQVAGQLPGDELVPGKIVVESTDHPIAIRPRVALAIDLKAVAVGITSHVEPIGRHPLAVTRRS